MLAKVSESKVWKDGSIFPILVIHANDADSKQDLEALEKIEEALSDVVGKTYGGKLVSTQKGSGQHGLFVVDLSGILTMLKAVKESSEKSSLARTWISNWLKKKVRPEWMTAHKKDYSLGEKYTCRCGMEYSGKKAKKRYRTHKKKCSILRGLDPLFKRCKEFEERERNARKKEKSAHKSTSRKTKGSGSTKAAEDRRVDRRTKTRRPTRKNPVRKK